MVWVDEKLDANEGEQLASSFSSPQTVRIGPRYVTGRAEQYGRARENFSIA